MSEMKGGIVLIIVVIFIFGLIIFFARESVPELLGDVKEGLSSTTSEAFGTAGQ